MIYLREQNLIRKVRGDILDELRKGIAIGMLFGSGGHGNLMEKTATENGVYTASEEIDPETEEPYDPPMDGYSVFTVDLALDDKSVSLTTSQITGSQTAEFEYDPHDEDPELEGYSLFTIDLSAVKTVIEELQQTIDDINQLLEEDDPDYDPTTDDPVQQVNNVIEEKDQKEQEAEECEECRAEVIAKMQEYDPDFDPQTCQDMVDEIDKIADEHDGYVFPENTDIDNIIPVIAPQDPVEIDGNDYYFVYKSQIYFEEAGAQVHEYNVFQKAINTDPVRPYYPFRPVFKCRAFVYAKTDNTLVNEIVLLDSDGGNIETNGWFQITGLRIDYTNKTLISDWERDIYADGNVRTGTAVNSISAYLTTQSPNPQYKVRNS